MNRRTVLHLLGSGAAMTALAGCVGDDDETGGSPDGGNGDDGDDNSDNGGPEPGQYNECGRELIPYQDLPGPVQEEIDAAMDEPYEAEYVFLQETMDTEWSYLNVDGDYYAVDVESNDVETLTLEHVEPQALPSGRSVHVNNGSDEAVTVDVTVETEGGDILEETTLSVEAGASDTAAEIHQVGTHDLTVTVDEELTETFAMAVSESIFTHEVEILADEIRHGHDIAGLEECDFDP